MKYDAMTWDLQAIYPDAAAWEKDFLRLPELAEQFAGFQGHLSDGPAVLRRAIEVSDSFERLEEKLYSYAHLLSDENTGNNVNRSRVDRLCGKLAELSVNFSWFEPEVMAVDEELMHHYLESEELSFYRRSLLELLREKPHTLSAAEEKVIGRLGDVLGTPDEIFSTLNDTDLEFGKVRDENGKLQTLSHGSWHRFSESPDRSVRKKAFAALYRRYDEFRNTFAAALDGTVKRHTVMSVIRHYDSPLQMALFGDEVPEELYTCLIERIHGYLPELHRYFQFRADFLKLPDLDMYDLYAPLFPQFRREYDFPEAGKLVKKALRPLGEEYVSAAELAWTQRWIDVPERKGKRSGAYSGGCYDTYPYILLNYNNTLNDVFTLAHELGHSMHSYFSRTAQQYHYADYEIFVAEVASTTNELLLADHLLKNSSEPAFKAYLLAHLADEFRATVFRQTMFAEFELLIHRAAAAGTPLTADFLEEEYYRLNALYHGPAIKADRRIGMEWARIPHFYYFFYVYKYATGMISAVKLADNLLSGDPDKREAYLNFLKAGDTKPVLELLKDAGVDLLKPEPLDEAMKFFSGTVEKLRKISGETGC